MTLEQQPFIRYNLEKKIDSFTVRLNEEERELLNRCKKIIKQPKDSTALKTLAILGAKVIQEEKTSFILATLFKNKKNNYRVGVSEIE